MRPLCSHESVEDCSALGKPLERPDLIGTHEAAVAFHICCEGRGELPADIAFGYSFPTHTFEPVTPIRPYVHAAVAAGGAGEPILDPRYPSVVRPSVARYVPELAPARSQPKLPKWQRGQTTT